MPSIANFFRRHFLLAILSIAGACVLVWVCFRLGAALYVVDDTFNVTLANDARTGKYLGEVVKEVRGESGEVIAYKIRRSDGSTVEVQANSVTTFKP
jgi:hypothetical protein